MEQVEILGISGKRESGKSLLASYLEHYHGWTRFSLADELKKEVMRDWGLTSIQLWGKEKEVATKYVRTDGNTLTARDIMIRHGVYRRSVDLLYFCKKFDPRIGDKIVIDDIRFLNEVKYFKTNYNTKFIRLNRSQGVKPHPAALDDLSETEMDSYKDFDWVLQEDANVFPKDLQNYAEYINLQYERKKLAF